jgi:hypothetical protein
MPSADKIVRTYEDLADYYDRKGDAPVRDRFLVQAADAALSGGQPQVAERLRARLLKVNPHHLLKPFTSFAEAARSPDIQSYIAGLRRNYPYDAAQGLLDSLRLNEISQPPGKAPAADGPREPPAQRDVLPVYRLQDAAPGGKSTPAPARPPANRPAPRPMPAPAQPVQPYRLARDNAPRTAPRSGVDEEGPPAGAWFCMALFVLTLAAGLALGAYTFASPFLR